MNKRSTGGGSVGASSMGSSQGSTSGGNRIGAYHDDTRVNTAVKLHTTLDNIGSTSGAFEGFSGGHSAHLSGKFDKSQNVHSGKKMHRNKLLNFEKYATNKLFQINHVLLSY